MGGGGWSLTVSGSTDTSVPGKVEGCSEIGSA